MRVGFSLPQLGPIASPEALVQAAQRAEALQYDSLWVVERVLYPMHPRTPYPATPDGSLPEGYKYVFDPIETLTFVAAHTKQIALGTSVLVIPFYNPVMLARRLGTLDVLSGGRLRIGLGLGWSEDEYEAAGASFHNRGARADEFLQVLKAIWTMDPVEFHGQFYHLPSSIIQLKPIQKPHPPLYLAAYTPKALQRVAKMADGWHPAGIPISGMAQMMENLRSMMKAGGRDPSTLQIVVRANLMMTDQPVEQNRPIFTGTPEQIQDDITGCRHLGVHELFFDPIFSPDGQSLERFLARMEQLRKLV